MDEDTGATGQHGTQVTEARGGGGAVVVDHEGDAEFVVGAEITVEIVDEDERADGTATGQAQDVQTRVVDGPLRGVGGHHIGGHEGAREPDPHRHVDVLAKNRVGGHRRARLRATIRAP